ncbi:hypothetical protein A5844_002427 [Enterococcus sp. 10A9_DIV0425]|uniref:Uncharacterized protein n=1 Tax=Candidatus Enterococcus wittei TaxID=1987383 RepID=A0A242JWE9_9ENTE|nr:hypothetical protein [Enterococcus sp. 10A9_DIV0425]OTP09647.1 hypothetical protein A5844_002427 [Enterococcus sp. 10A9_DIV0425]THE15217.1 hypothetical protein E1H99_03435 [Enterococcus hirae]
MDNKQTSPVVTFGFKTSIFVLIACLIGGIIIPYCFYLLHWDVRLGIFFFLPLCLATVITGNHYFISSTKGFTKGCILTFFLALGILMFVAYLWLYKGIIF